MSDDILLMVGWFVVMAIAWIGEFAGFLILAVPMILLFKFLIGKVKASNHHS